MEQNQTQQHKQTLFDRLISPALQYVGMIGAVIMSVAYIVIAVILINGFKAHTLVSSIVFAAINACVGLLIMQCLKIQGTSFAKNLPENKKIIEEYYNTKTKDKKVRSITYYWTTSVIKDVIWKGLTFAATTMGIIYIVVQGSHDYALLLLAFVNLIMFICFGILGLNNAYEFYNNRHVPYMREKIKEFEEEKKNEQQLQRDKSTTTRHTKPNRIQQKKKCRTRRTNRNNKLDTIKPSDSESSRISA